MRKPAAVIAVLSIFLVAYLVAIRYELIPHWLIVGFAPFAIVFALVVIVLLGGYVILFGILVSEFVVHMKEKFLLKYGTETQAIEVESELYHGPGLHPGDPCYRGKYSFTDQRGRVYSFKFSRECYDPYDLNSWGIPIDEHYQKGVERRLIYWEWMPAIHYLYGPDVNAPRLRGSFGLYKME